jgi:hypothetical protein
MAKAPKTISAAEKKIQMAGYKTALSDNKSNIKSFDPSVTYAKLVFSNPQPNENVAVGFGRQDEAKALLAVEPDVSGFVKAPVRGAKAGARR